MMKVILGKFGLITKLEAEEKSRIAALTAVSQVNSIRPGDELIKASECMKKYGFKVVYALGDGNAKENAIRLSEEISLSQVKISPDRMVRQFLPNVKNMGGASLLK
jgi:hypothetical protein